MQLTYKLDYQCWYTLVLVIFKKGRRGGGAFPLALRVAVYIAHWLSRVAMYRTAPLSCHIGWVVSWKICFCYQNQASRCSW